VKSIALLAALVALAMAQHWDIEQVDSSATGGPTVVWLPDGRLAACYLSGDTAVRVAIKDSVWHYETVAPAGLTSTTIAVGPHGTVGVVYYAGGICYAERNGSGWETTHLPIAGHSPNIAYDTADVPLVTSIDDPADIVVYAQTRPDTSWLTREIYRSSPGSPSYGSYAPPRFDRNNQAYVFVSDYWYIFLQVWGADFALLSGHGDTWQIVRDSSLPDYEPAEALALDTAGKPAWCFTDCYGNLYFEEQLVYSGLSCGASAWFDALNRPQIAYLVADDYPSGRLKYAYRRGGTWFGLYLPDTNSVSECDLLLNTLNQPIIAYVRSGGGLFIARGVDIAGQSEERRGPIGSNSRLTASIASRVLCLPVAGGGRMAKDELLDAAGRKVLDLHFGANNVSSLAPGVYFVREKPQASSPTLQAVRKVIITR
jgi:hypothetical protein